MKDADSDHIQTASVEKMILGAFPDFTVTVDDVIQRAYRCRLGDTVRPCDGTLGGIDPIGEKVEM